MAQARQSCDCHPVPYPRNSFRERFLDVLASIYLYNEHRGYTSFDRVLDAVRQRCPDNPAFIAAIAKHRADERKHYVMFKRWFELRGHMPLAVDSTCGHIDRFIFKVFGCSIDDLDTQGVIASPDAFEKLCRVIMLTEQRGMRQVEILLGNRHVRSDKAMKRIFEVVEKDEPDHWMPYAAWLDTQGRAKAKWRERWADYWIHKSLMLVKLPSLFLRRSTPRMAAWPDATEQIVPKTPSPQGEGRGGVHGLSQVPNPLPQPLPAGETGMDGAIEDRRPSLLSRVVRKALVWFYRQRGWTAHGTPPADGRCVIVAAPHTSNWDFVNFIGLTEDLGLKPHFMAKDSLFRWPLGGFMRDMGGVSIDRKARRNVVDAMVAEFARRDRFMLTIAPEGTRSQVGQWRSGFYHIALKAGVPIVIGMMDYGNKTGGLGPAIWPSGDYAADMRKLFEFYSKVTPRHPGRGLKSLPEIA